MTLWGEPADAEFPALCPNCGAAAANRLWCSKAFARSGGSDTPNTTVVLSAEVPFCDTCIARHRGEAHTPGPLSVLLSGFASGEMIGAVALAAAALFTAYLALEKLLRLNVSHAVPMLVLAAFFGLLARFQARQAWRDTGHCRLPPQSSVTQAFDFSDNEPAPFESPKFECTMRDAGFAAAFRALNRDREFRPGSPAALADRRQANRQTWIIGGIVAVVALLLLIRDLLK